MSSADLRATLLTTGQTVMYGSAVPFWRESAVIAAQSSNAINIFNASSAAAARWVAPVAGSVIGCSVGGDAQISAGTLTLEVYVNNALSQSFAALSSADTLPKVILLGTAATFTANQTVDFRYSSDASLAGLAQIQVIPIFLFS